MHAKLVEKHCYKCVGAKVHGSTLLSSEDHCENTTVVFSVFFVWNKCALVTPSLKRLKL